MKLAEIAANGTQPLEGAYACTLTVANGAISAINFTTPIPVADGTVEELNALLARSLTRQNQANIQTIASVSPDDILALNSVAQGANFDPTAYVADEFAPPIDLTADLGDVTPNFSQDSGGESTVALGLVVDRDGKIIESVPVVTID